MACSVLAPCGPLDMEGDWSLLPSVVGNVVGVSLPPTVVSVSVISYSVLVCLVHVICTCTHCRLLTLSECMCTPVLTICTTTAISNTVNV